MIHLTVQQLSASLDGALTGPSLELIVRHLAACHECRDRQARLAKHDDALRRLLAQDPTDVFLDELMQRATTLVSAIAHGQPAPVMTTSVPLLHEEDPYAPVEPPPRPARPELGRSGEIAKVAGWGRIGVKPTAATHAPPSDPEEARRLLEAVGRDTADDFTELSAKGLNETAPVDGPTFDLPGWIKEQSGQPVPRGDARRQLPRVEVFFEAPDPPAPGPAAAPPGHAARRDGPPARPSFAGVPPGQRPVAGEPPAASVPAEHAGYAPPGWGGATAPPAPGAFAAAGGSVAPAPLEGPLPLPWNPGGGEPALAGQNPYAQPFAGEFSQPWPAVTLAAAVSRRRAARGVDQVALLALGSVAALLVIVLALQLARPTRPRRTAPATTSASGDARQAAPAPSRPESRPASAQLPLEQVLPPMVPPDPEPTEAVAMPSRATHETAAPHAREPEAAQTARGSARAPAHGRTRVPFRATHGVTDLVRQPTASAHALPPPTQPATGPAHAAALPTPTAATPSEDHSASAADHAAPAPAPPAPAAAETAPAQQPTATPAHDAAAAAAADDGADQPLLCGTIEDDAGQPVSGARVSMKEAPFAARTDAHGRFCISAAHGAHSLFIEASGFTPQRTPVTFSATSADVHIRLQPAR